MELRLKRADRDELVVGGAIAAIEIGAAVEQIAAALRPPPAHRGPSEDLRREQRGPIDHRGIDDLAAPADRTLDECREHAHRQQHAPAAEIGDIVDRRHGWPIEWPDQAEPAAHRQIIDVVPGLVRHRPRLAPPGHARVNQSEIGGDQRLRTEAEALHHAGPETFDKDVGTGRGRDRQRLALGRFQIDRDGGATAIEEIVALVTAAERLATAPIDPQYLRAHVGEHHRAERRGPQSGEFDHADARQRTAHRATALTLRASPGRSDTSRARRSGTRNC